jgi:tetratricopeptide (TPR) repeat protein
MRWPRFGIWRLQSARELLDALNEEDAQPDDLPGRRDALERLAEFASRRKERGLEGEARFLLGTDLLAAGELNLALAQIRAAAILFEAGKDNPRAMIAHDTVADLAEKIGAAEVAEEALDRRVSLFRERGGGPDLAAALTRLGSHRLREGEDQSAWSLAQEALSQDGQSVDTLLLASDAATSLSQDSEALDYAEKALALATAPGEEARASLAVLAALPWPTSEEGLTATLETRIHELLTRGARAAEEADDAALTGEIMIMQAVRLEGGLEGALTALAGAFKALTDGMDAILFARGVHVATQMAGDESRDEAQQILEQVFNALRAALGSGYLLMPQNLPVAFGVLYHVIDAAGGVGSWHATLRDQTGELAKDLQDELAADGISELIAPAVDLLVRWLKLVATLADAGFSLNDPRGRVALDDADGLVAKGLPQKNADLLLDLCSRGAAVV